MKNLKKLSRENLKTVQGGVGESGCRPGLLLCYDITCTPTCMSPGQCKVSFCFE
ncbi:hypothetical protein LF887_13310 [Chryseobacterium sp. MEBOG06]|uniref:bacteriocin-like protein n=1 Tax=unclassified Chryseobacterium TaxID=2593645 RepID=UPI001F42360A|nr:MULTISPECIES: hypothetical protein [unclassified Chryseobacterium]UKB81983.1 hypothetical protein LF887_13310 [Chryseobacterium sp. MEBOG06]